MFDANLPSGLVTFVLLGLLGRWLLSLTFSHRATMALQIRLFWWAYVIRFALAIVIYQFGFLTVLGDFDASGWVYSVYMYDAWVRDGLTPLNVINVLMTGPFQNTHQGHYYALSTLFYLTNLPGRLSAAALNCFVGALTVVFAYRIARSLFSEWVAHRVAWWTCFFPSLIIWSAQTLKEPIVIFLETVALYGCLRLRQRGFSARYALMCAATVILILPFRFYAAYICGSAILLSLFLPRLSGRRMTLGSGVAVAALVIPLVMMSGALAQNEAQFEQFDLQFIQDFRKNIAVDSGSGVETQFDMTTTTGFGLATAVGLAHLLLAPFPWQLTQGSLRMVLTTPELIYWWWLFAVGVIPGTIYLVRTKLDAVMPVIFFIVGLGLLYSVLFGNVGLVFRQRAQILPWLLIFAAVGLERRVLRQARLRKQRRAPAAPGILVRRPA